MRTRRRMATGACCPYHSLCVPETKEDVVCGTIVHIAMEKKTTYKCTYMDKTRVGASHVTVMSYTDTCDLESVNKSGVKRLLTSSFVDLDISWFIHWTIHRNTNTNPLTDINTLRNLQYINTYLLLQENILLSLLEKKRSSLRFYRIR